MVATLLGCVSASMAAAPTPDQIEFFEKKIRPVLVDRCYECHSEVKHKIKGKLRLDDYAAMLKGGDSGKPAVVPGDPDKSWLVIAMTYTDKDTDTHDAVLMPPPKNGKPRKLPDSVIQDFKDWVQMGAPYPTAAGHAEAAPVDPRQQHWAFVAPKEPAIPQVTDAAWVKNDIDRFILSKLEAQDLHPSHPADKRTLIRRATFDLIGFPPTDGEVKDFESDSAPDAFEKVIDRLLASPQYGERWGRYWLDVARYADTKGYVFEEERRYPYSYTYRDWVIGAFNADLPYDQFLIDQIAADRLDLKDDHSALAAEGFLTLGRRFLNNQPDIIDDRIDVVCRGTMALTVGCARCHDHKFDPISQKDYYSLYSVFNNSPEAHELPLIGSPKPTSEYEHFTQELAKKEAGLSGFSQKTLDADIASLRTAKQITVYLLATHSTAPAVVQKAPTKRRKGEADGGAVPWMTARWNGYINSHDSVFAAWRELAKLPADEFAVRAPAVLAELARKAETNLNVLAALNDPTPNSLNEVADRYGHLLATSDGPLEYEYADEEALRQVLRGADSPTQIKFEERAQIFATKDAQHERALRREIEAFKASDPGAPPRAMALEDAPSNAPQNVFLRGNPGNPGPMVKPAFLSIVSEQKPADFKHGSGRLEMARDIASDKNPLTARVMVNRVWLHHFGKGLVRTPSDFGMRSDPPTHPELLDWLALRFEQDHWSIKHLHKLIMLSSAYQQSSDVNSQVEKADPDNMLVSHFNRQRLDWEATRDSLLFVSGKLDTKLGGRSVEVLESPRRTVYGFIDRQNLPGVFRAFDFATPDATSPQRFTTTVPQQALFLMNSPFAVQQAKALVGRAEIASSQENSAKIERLYELVYQREPTTSEITEARRFVEADANASAKLTAWQQYAQVLLESNEFVFVD